MRDKEKYMFEVGERYTINMLEGSTPVSWGGCLVVEVDLPLVKIKGQDGEKILNTASHAFVSASRSNNEPSLSIELGP